MQNQNDFEPQGHGAAPLPPLRWHQKWQLWLAVALLVPVVSVGVLWWCTGVVAGRLWYGYLEQRHACGEPITVDEAVDLQKREWLAAREAAHLSSACVRLSRYGTHVAGLPMRGGEFGETEETYSREPYLDAFVTFMHRSRRQNERNMLMMLQDYTRKPHARERRRGSNAMYCAFFINERQGDGEGSSLRGYTFTEKTGIPPEGAAYVRGTYGKRSAFLWRSLLYMEPPDPLPPRLPYPDPLDQLSYRLRHHTSALYMIVFTATRMKQPDIAVDAWIDAQLAMAHPTWQGKDVEFETDDIGLRALEELICSGMLTEKHYRRMLAAPVLTADDFRAALRRWNRRALPLAIEAAKETMEEPREEYAKGLIDSFQKPAVFSTKWQEHLIYPWLPVITRTRNLLRWLKECDAWDDQFAKQTGSPSWNSDFITVKDAGNYDDRAGIESIEEIINYQNIKRAALLYGLYCVTHNGRAPEDVGDFLATTPAPGTTQAPVSGLIRVNAYEFQFDDNGDYLKLHAATDREGLRDVEVHVRKSVK